MKVTEIHPGEYNEFYQGYINNIPKDQSLGMLFLENKEELLRVLDEIPGSKLQFRYAEGKWSVAEVLQHLIDVERIFQYRALSIARNDQTSLPGFDHDSYVEFSEADRRSVEDFKAEFDLLRDSTKVLYDSFSEGMLQRIGNMNNAPASPRAIGFIIIGHTMHHLKILNERYLK